jgi:antitoxin YqcF
MPTKISSENQLIAKTILDVFGGTPDVWSYLDENNKSKVDILSCKDIPAQSITSYSTIGLSDFSIGIRVGEVSLGIEIAGACRSGYEFYSNIISTCAFYVINSDFKCRPGATMKNIVEMYYPDISMKHILFLPPFGWRKEFPTLEFSKKKVTWLLSVPISDMELSYIIQKGVDTLETLFDEIQIDIYNLERKSVL